MPLDERPVVYSTDPNFTSRTAGSPPKGKSLPPHQQTAGLVRERKGRGGKIVTIICDLQLNDEDLKSLSKLLKQACGAGGTVKDGVIEIQGDHRDKIAARLKESGYKVKLIGG